MLDEEAVTNLFNQIHTVWVEPEINRRRDAGQLPDGFRIRRCLVKLPPNQAPVVQFNNEIGWVAKVRKPKGTAFDKGDPVFLPQIERIMSVDPPTVDDKPVAFFYVYWTGLNWQIIFDCSPNTPGEQYDPSNSAEWTLGQAIAESINLQLAELSIRMHDAQQDAIRSIGLWAVPALLPYPLSAIADACKKGHQASAREILVKHCIPEFLSQVVKSWSAVSAFTERSTLFADALSAHEDRRYTLSIHSLIPQVEGVITDWVHSHVASSDVPWRQESKTRKFQDVLQAGPARTYTDDRGAQSIVDFILNGPLLGTFKDWLQAVQVEFPNRNVVGHGKHVMTLYSEENSIKAFLVLDTLYHTMALHDSASELKNLGNLVPHNPNPGAGCDQPPDTPIPSPPPPFS